jgi:hypothetical protein
MEFSMTMIRLEVAVSVKSDWGFIWADLTFHFDSFYEAFRARKAIAADGHTIVDMREVMVWTSDDAISQCNLVEKRK